MPDVSMAAPAKRFVVNDDEGHSDFWRRNKSPIEPVELAKLLAGLRHMASFVGRNVSEIVWSGMDIENAIALDPTPIMGRYPVPASSVDLMVGLTLQEAFRRREWSERVRLLSQQQGAVAPQYEYKFNLFIERCEALWIDTLANRNVFGHYAEVARAWQIKRNTLELLSPPTLSEALHLWWEMAASRDPALYLAGYTDRTIGNILNTQSLDRYYKQPIDILNRLVAPLRERCVNIQGVAERVDFRVGLYLKVWRDFLPFVRFWPGDCRDRTLVPDFCDEQTAIEDEERKAVKATIISHAHLIERALPTTNRDFTEELKENVENADGVVRLEGSDIVMIARDKIDRRLLRSLERVIVAAAQRSTSYNRGLTSGKIYARRLYRAHTTGAVFQEKRHAFDLRNDVTLLVDATGSMADPAKWERAEVVYQTLFTAIRRFNHQARLFAYNEVRDACRITELYRRDTMLTIVPHGKTASGEAIIGTALSTRKTGRHRLLVHITDGASNWGCGVHEAVAYCKRQGVALLTLGIGCSPVAKQSLRDEYGPLVQFADRLDELPRLVAALLRYERTA
jgi:hypothetical protein